MLISEINFIFLSHFFFILSICISFLGLFSNFTVIFVISHKKNEKELKELKYFHYMRLNAIFNSLIFIIRILSLMSECEDLYFLYCPSIHRLVPMQLEKIIFSEFLGNTFRYMSSLSFIAFTLSRISLLGKDHGKIVTWISELSMKKFISISLIFSVSFCFVKIFKYNLNLENPNFTFPIIFYDFPFFRYHPTLYQVFLIFNMICDFINCVLLVIVQLIVDICLVVQLKRTLASKMETSSKDKKKQDKENEEKKLAVKKAVLMVILNASFNLLLKSPTAIQSIYDLADGFARIKPDNPLSIIILQFYEVYCIDLRFCLFFDELVIFLYLFSLCLNLVFFYKFDKSFKSCFFNALSCFEILNKVK